MSKKLLIAVLTLGLLFAYCGAVLGDIPGNIQRTPLPTSNPNAPLLNAPEKVNDASLQKPPDEGIFAADVTLFPPPYYCDFIDYTGGNFAFYMTIPNSAGFDLYNMKFTAEDGYACTLLTAWTVVYADAFVGTPDLVVKVWDDDGFGLPGTELASVTIPYASLPTSGAWYVPADFSSFNLIFEDGENYFVGVTTTDQVNDQLAFLIDDGTNGQGRSGFYDNASAQFYNRADIGFTDYNFGIAVDICCYDLPYSNCQVVEYNCGASGWFDPTFYGATTFPLATRYETEGNDTLVAVEVAVYGGGSFGTDDLDVFVWGDNAGFPDLSNVIYSATIPNASIQYYPAVNNVPVGLVLPYGTTFHVGFDAVAGGGATQHAPLLDDGTCGELRSTANFGGTWYTNFDLFGVDLNWIVAAEICKDEFSVCFTQQWAANLAYVWWLPTAGSSRTGYYQKFSPTGIGCRLEEVRHFLYDYGFPDAHTEDVDCWVYPDVGGVPGTTPLAQVTIPTTDMVYFPAPTPVDFAPYNILFDEAIWVGLEKYYTSPEGIVTILSDDGYGVPRQSAVHYVDDAGTSLEWLILSDIGDGYDHNFLMEADICCIPPEERPCVPEIAPDPNWPTCGHDFRRSSASDNPTPNARCEQDLLWSHTDAAGFIYNRPILYDSLLVAAYNTKLQVFNAYDGTLLWTESSLPYMSSGFRNSVTVKDGYVYFGGGNAKSFQKFDVYTGALVWSRNPFGTPLAANENTGWTTSIILDCNGTEVIFLTDDAGNLYALETATGADYAGWSPNPINIGGGPYATLSSNGVDKLYVGHDGGGAEGSIIAIDACTGTIDWELGYPDLAGDDIVIDPPLEWFRGPLAVDGDGSIYAMSACDNFFPGTDPGTPNGVRYKIDAMGNIVWAKGGYYTYYSGPVLDANYVYFKTWAGYLSDPDNNMTALSKNNGGFIWQADPAYSTLGLVEPALSCEPLEPDLLYNTNREAQLVVHNADDGLAEFEYNYIGTGSTQGCGVAIDPDKMCFTTRQGDIFCFTSTGTDRPRLRILKDDELQPVPFFSPPSYPVTFEDVFMNTGCANLTGNLTANETPVNPSAVVWSVDPDRVERLQNAADNMIDNSFASLTGQFGKSQDISKDIDQTSPYSRDSYSNMAAYAPPAWLNAITTATFDLADGQTHDVVYDVNGPLVTRGPHYCYVMITSNDTYYINDPTLHPEVQLGVLGGCLETDDVLFFGVGEANQVPVFNTGELMNQNGAADYIFDGADGFYYQGGFFFATDKYEMAWTTDTWQGLAADFWQTLLPDPNCFEQCEPYITPDPIVLGSIWDGTQYVDIEGYVTAVAYVDSVINYDCFGTGWDWENNTCPFDNNLTIGIKVDQYMYGAIDVPELNNVVIYRHDITNRNADPITGLGFGGLHDYDIAVSGNYYYDTWKMSEDYGIAYGTDCFAYTGNELTAGWGTIPMDNMVNAVTLDPDQGMFEPGHVWLDSIYYYMTNVTGQAAQTGGSPIEIDFPCTPASATEQDRELWTTYFLGDLGPNETITMGTYTFAFTDGDVNNDQFFYDLATLVNQLSGFDRGDMDGDGDVDLADVVALWNIVDGGGNPPLFAHMADVNASGGLPDMADVLYLADYYFCLGPAPSGDWALPNICPTP